MHIQSTRLWHGDEPENEKSSLAGFRKRAKRQSSECYPAVIVWHHSRSLIGITVYMSDCAMLGLLQCCLFVFLRE